MFITDVCAHVCGCVSVRARVVYRQPVEKVVALLFGVALEELEVLEHLLVHGNLIVVADAVFAQEIKDDPVRRLECDMLVSERTAAHRVGLLVAFFVPRSQRQLVDQVHGCGTLSRCHDLVLELLGVGRPDISNHFFQLARLHALSHHSYTRASDRVRVRSG